MCHRTDDEEDLNKRETGCCSTTLNFPIILCFPFLFCHLNLFCWHICNHIYKRARKCNRYFFCQATLLLKWSRDDCIHLYFQNLCFSKAGMIRKQMVWSKDSFVVGRIMFPTSCQGLVCNFKIAVFPGWPRGTIKILDSFQKENTNFFAWGWIQEKQNMFKRYTFSHQNRNILILKEKTYLFLGHVVPITVFKFSLLFGY